jgi:hypothetical protein
MFEDETTETAETGCIYYYSNIQNGRGWVKKCVPGFKVCFFMLDRFFDTCQMVVYISFLDAY